MKLDTIVTIKPEPDDKGRRKGIVRPRIDEEPWRRRFTGDFIELYDLAQVSGDGVTFTDHPLLKVPSYSTSFSGSGSSAKLVFSMEQFGTSDYQAYTDMMFNVPIEEWHIRYKRLEYEPKTHPVGTAPLNTTYPTFFSLATNAGNQAMIFQGPGALTNNPVRLATYDIVLDDPAAYTAAVFEAAGMSWWYNYPTKMPVKGLPYIESGNSYLAGKGSWFPFSTTNKVNFKVTTVRDPDAPDAGVITPSGLTRIFLMPHITSWAASAANTNLEDKYVMGPVYQITPRRLWPRFTDTEWEHSEGNYTVLGFTYNAVIDDPDDRKADFLEYQAARGGMQASSWVRPTIGSGTPVAFNGAMSPLSFPIGNNYFSQGSSGAVDVGIWLDTGGVNGLGGSANPYRADLSFATPEFQWFDMTEPFLCAVIQKGSTYYYVWSITPASNYSNAQGQKYRLSLRYDKNFADLRLDDLDVTAPA